MDHRQEKQPRNELHALTRRGPEATPSNERGGRVLTTRMRCDAAASRRPRHVGTERCKSGTDALQHFALYRMKYQVYDTRIHIIGVVVLTFISI